MADSFVYKQYKGHDVELPLTDEMREFLLARSKDTMVAECDAVWENLQNRPDAEEPADEPEDADDVAYDQLKVAELKAEIADRNSERDDEDKIQVPADAKKPDLIALLEKDDEEFEDDDETARSAD
jgi:hypothetical protein